MKLLWTILFLNLTANLLAVPTTMKLEEKEYYQYIQKIRSRKFADREIDRLHQSLGTMVSQIQDHVLRGSVAQAARYNDHLPGEEEVMFQKDKDGKEYFTMQLSQGITYDDYPVYHVYETRAYLYPSEDKKGLAKVVVQFNRVNSTGTDYVKEMRRIINPTPHSPGPPKVEGEKNGDIPKFQEENITDPSIAGDENADLIIEFYTSNDFYLDDQGKEDRFKERAPEEKEARYLLWTDKNPDTKTKVGLTRVLGDEKELMPFEVQKKIYLTYRDVLRELDSKIKSKLNLIELNKRRTIHKIMEFN